MVVIPPLPPLAAPSLHTSACMHESAEIISKGNRLHLGYYATELAAAMAYDDAAVMFHKEAATLNLPFRRQKGKGGDNGDTGAAAATGEGEGVQKKKASWSVHDRDSDSGEEDIAQVKYYRGGDCFLMLLLLLLTLLPTLLPMLLLMLPSVQLLLQLVLVLLLMVVTDHTIQ